MKKQGRIHGQYYGRVGRGRAGAGAEMHVFTLFDSCLQTDGWTDRRTDGQTKALIELRIRN